MLTQRPEAPGPRAVLQQGKAPPFPAKLFEHGPGASGPGRRPLSAILPHYNLTPTICI